MKHTHSIAGIFCLHAASAFILILCISGSVHGQDSTVQAMAQNMAEMKFAPFPGLPTCTPGSVQSGDPAKGPSIILAKIAAGCIIPWHWHTPNERLMLVSGVATVQMKDGKPVTLRAGGFATMPAHHVHQFRCIKDCVLYIYSDAAFDIHYVDKEGKEIPPDEALKAVKETTVTLNK